MMISAAELKRTLKLLAPVRSETYVIGEHGISAQDSDVWVVVASPLSELGSFSLLGKKLTQVANRMSGQVEITKTDQSVVLKSAKAKIELEAKPAKKQVFPETVGESVVFNAAEFKRALALAAGSVDAQKSKWCGDVVHLESLALGIEEEAPSGWRAVGTDEKILTVVTVKTPQPQFDWLLNLTAAGLVQIMESESIAVSRSANGLLLGGGSLAIWASVPDKKYLSISPILAGAPTLRASFKPEDWLAAFRTVEPLIDEVDGERHVALHFRDGVVQFSTSGTGATAEDETGYEQLAPDPLFDPQEITLVFCAEHLSGFLAKAIGEAVLNFVAFDKPVRMETQGVQVMMFPRKGSKRW